MYIKWMDACLKTRVLTRCCCAGSGEEGVMEDVKTEKCVHKVDGNMQKMKSTKVENLWRILHIMMPMRVRGNWPRLAL